MRLEWARDGENHESDLTWLLEFLHKEIERKERSQAFNSCSAASEEKRSSTHMPTAAALVSSSYELCAICGRAVHSIQHCFDLNKMSASERKETFRKKGVCFKCLSSHRGHKFRYCRSRCSQCQGWHNVLLCDQQNNERKTRKTTVTDKNDTETEVKSVHNDNVTSHAGIS